MRISAYESKIKEWMIVYMHAPSGVGIGECRVRCAKSRRSSDLTSFIFHSWSL